MNKFYSFISLLLLLSACSHDSSARPPTGLKPQMKLAEIYGISRNSEELTISVKSNGCTKAKHFQLESTQLDETNVLIKLYRLKSDMCKKKPFIMPIKLRLDHPFSDPAFKVQLGNPIHSLAQ